VEQKILALDFDGVIWDSVGECFVMARRAYQNLYGLPCADLEAAFRRGRWLVRTGGDFLLVLQLAMADPDGDLTLFSQEEFARLRAARATEVLEFEREFYGLRQRCRDDAWSDWVSYQQPYPVFLQQLEAVKDTFTEVVICTTKDSKSARLLLESAGLDFAIWGKELGVDKGEQMRDLCAQRGCSPEQVFFVDDLVENLDQVSPTGAACGLAAWGYNTEGERERARQQGYPVFEVFSFARDIRKMVQERCSSPG
jgi:phosphoglycolate phosphatase-like HAD superfamily hydrolase